MNKITDTINNLDNFSRYIILYGITIANALIIISIILSYLNKHFYNLDYTLTFNSIYICKVSLAIFSETIIGALLIDSFIKKIKK